MEEIIKVENLCFEYEPGLQTISNISFQIHKGEYVAILGHNGSGKSTIAKLLIGLLEKKSGEIYIDDYQLNLENLYKIREKVGIIFQNPDNQFIGATVRDDIAFGLENICVPREQMDELINRYSKVVRMENFLDHEPTKLSGGQKQRVAIARALANDPEILISDESTSALDPKTTKQILSLLQDLNKKLGLTVVMITHEMQIVKDICNRVAVMQNGQLLEEGSVLDIFSNPQEDLTQEFIETASGIEDALAKINAQPLVKNLPSSALLVQLKYAGSSTDEPLLTELFKEYGVSSNILYGNVEILGDTPVGELVVVLDGEADQDLAAQKAIENAGVSLQVLKKGAQ